MYKNLLRFDVKQKKHKLYIEYEVTCPLVIAVLITKKLFKLMHIFLYFDSCTD